MRASSRRKRGIATHPLRFPHWCASGFASSSIRLEHRRSGSTSRGAGVHRFRSRQLLRKGQRASRCRRGVRCGHPAVEGMGHRDCSEGRQSQSPGRLQPATVSVTPPPPVAPSAGRNRGRSVQLVRAQACHAGGRRLRSQRSEVAVRKGRPGDCGVRGCLRAVNERSRPTRRPLAVALGPSHTLACARR